MSKRSAIIASALITGALALSNTAYALEGGISIYPHGVENFLVGAAPPPGLYANVFANYYHADQFNDGNGNDAHIPGFSIKAYSITPRIAWVTNNKVLGGDLLFHTIFPLVDLKVAVAGSLQHKTGIADITAGPAIAYHHSQNLHSIVAFNTYFPTGEYNKTDLANIGTNHYAFEPLYIVTYVNPTGFNGDARIGYIFNRTNSDTDYKSGQEFHIDYSLGWGLNSTWTVGIGGYYLQQTTSDRQAGADVPNSKTKAFSVGPSIKWDSEHHWFITAKWEKEIEAENHTKGSATWLKFVFPL